MIRPSGNFYGICFLTLVLAAGSGAVAGPLPSSGSGLQGQYDYDQFKKPERCGQCHTEIYQQWKQGMHSQAYTHHWDEIEYFELAIPHARKDEKVAEVEAGCNGCHTPLALMVGDIPPARVEEGTRANEGVSCVVCHSISGFEGDTPFNFNFTIEPGNLFHGPRGVGNSPEHEIKKLPFIHTAEFCGLCHNEKNPYGFWVKSTHLEWKEGPWSAEGVQCQTCHMPGAPMTNAKMGGRYDDVRQHMNHGAHDTGKIRGSVEMRITPDVREAILGDPAKLTLVLHNAKAGHKIPTGSAEERQVWVRVEAVDSEGTRYHLPVDRKGFKGEKETITSNEPVYFDIGEIQEIEGFKGLERDALPEGDRIFCLPYFDPQGRRTICQWNTGSLGVDYRIGPRETKVETYTWELPEEMPPGPVTVTAVLNYRRLVKSVADHLKVPADETEIIEINRAETTFNVID